MTEPGAATLGRWAGRGRDLSLASLTAVLTFMAFPTAWAPTLTFWPLIWFSHVPLFWLLRRKAPKAAFWWGFLTGTLINAGGYYWITDLLVTFGGLPTPVAVLGMVLHAMSVGVLWALWAWGINRIMNTTPVPLEWAAPVVMVAVEIAVPRIFPAYMGNSQYLFLPVMQVVDLFGVTAVTFLIYRVNAVLFLWLRAKVEGRQRPKRAAWVTVAMLAATLGYGGVRMVQMDAAAEAATTLKVGLVEADVGIFARESADNVLNHLLIQQNMSAALEAQGAELIVWPESAYRYQLLGRGKARFKPSEAPLVDDHVADRKRRTSREEKASPQRGFKTPLLFGGTSAERLAAPRWEGDASYAPYNTTWLLDAEGFVKGTYDKVVLLLFGEYVPFVEYMPWFYKLIPAAGMLEPGKELGLLEADLWEKGPVRFGMLVCYESILPAFARPLGAGRPHMLINLTNDDWFGLTPERYLHFALSVPRAIEHRVPMVRSTLTGVSAFIDPVGRIVKQTRPTGPETLMWDVPLMQSVTVYQVVGDAFPWGCVLLSLGWLLWGRWRRR